jgi:hypothetical protein
MDASGQRFFILDLGKKNLGVKRIQADMKQTLGPDIYSKAQIARGLQRFQQSDVSCKDESRSGRRLRSLGLALSRFFSNSPFASACIIATHFGIARDSMRKILARELGPKKFSRRWLPVQLSEAQKQLRVEFS